MFDRVEEEVFIKGVAENPYNQGNLSKPVYFDSIEEFVDIDYRLIPNYIRSLEKKGLVNANNDYVWLTSKGIKIYDEYFQAKCA